MVDRVARHGVNYPPAHPSTAHLVATPCEHHLYALMMYVAGEWTQFGNADTKLGDEIARAQYLIRDGWVA